MQLAISSYSFHRFGRGPEGNARPSFPAMIEACARESPWPEGTSVTCLETGLETPTGGRILNAPVVGMTEDDAPPPRGWRPGCGSAAGTALAISAPRTRGRACR